MSYDDWKTRVPERPGGCPRCGRAGEFSRCKCVCESTSAELFQWMDSWTYTIEEMLLEGTPKDDPELINAFKQLSTIEEEMEIRGL